MTETPRTSAESERTAQEARLQLGMYLNGLVEQRAREPRDDMLSDLVNSKGPDGAMTCAIAADGESENSDLLCGIMFDDEALRSFHGMPADVSITADIVMALDGATVPPRAALDRGELPDIPAALVKDVGTTFEGDVIDEIRRVVEVTPSLSSPDPPARALAEAQLHAPGYTLRGGTNEILRGIVARGLGLR